MNIIQKMIEGTPEAITADWFVLATALVCLSLLIVANAGTASADAGTRIEMQTQPVKVKG